MIYSKSKEETSKSKARSNHRGKLCNANGIKAMNHILILSMSEEGTPKSNARNAIQGDSC